MGRRKELPTQQQIDDLANRAQDLAIVISNMADTINIMQPLETFEAAAKFNQMIEAAGKMNCSLLALERAWQERSKHEARARDQAT